MFDHFFITGPLPATIIQGEYIPLLVFASYLIATLGAFSGLTLSGRILTTTDRLQKRILHTAGALALGSGIWSMHFLGMLAYHTDMVHEYDPLLTTLSGALAITAAWFVIQITQVKTLSVRRLVISAVLLGLGIADMHYTGMAAMEMKAETYYIPSLFFVSIAIAIIASGAALWIVFTLPKIISSRQALWRASAAMVMGLAVCGMHYTGMEAAVIVPFADCRFDPDQNFFMLGTGVIAVTGLIFILSLVLGVANRFALLAACAAIFSLPLVTIVYHAVSGLNMDIRFTQREQQGMAYHEEMIDLLISLQRLQGLTHISQHEDTNDMVLVPIQKEDVRKWIAKVDMADRLYGASLGVSAGWVKSKEQFGHLLEEHNSHRHEEATREFSAHSEVIHTFMGFMESVVDKSNLNTDPAPDSSLVADVLFNLMPETAETLSRMSGLAAGYLTSSPSGQLKQEEIKALEPLYNQLAILDRLMENRLARSASLIRDSERFVTYYRTTINPLLTRFMQRYEHMLLGHSTEWTAQSLFAEATDITQAYDALYDDMIDGFSSTLEKRQAEYATKKNLVMASCVVAVIGFMALFTFLFRSLTKTERAEREARHARKNAEQAAAAKSDFLANMSHELRTPMNGVLGMATLLEDTPLSEEQKELVSTITGSAENLLVLLNDILDFSKIEAGVLVLEEIAYDVKRTMGSIVSLLQPQAQKKDIDLRLELDSEVPNYVWGDSGRMRQIITNLMGNAIKFTESGHVEVKVRMQEQNDKSWLHISVEDTGMGIPAHKLNEIFDKFTQADASITRKFGGTGLGLAITRQLVTLMKGHIGVESAEGKGSTFWFMIPCKPAQLSDVVATKESMQSLIQGSVTRLPIAQARALLVEDYPVNQVFAQKLLKKFGFEHIDLAQDGMEALFKYNENHYDIIFMDCQMPKLDGYITTQEIRMLEATASTHTPIVAMTANAMIGDREKCLNAGMDDYLSKPLRAGHLKKILESWFMLDQAKAAIEAPKSADSAAPKIEESPVDMEQLRMFTDGNPEEEKALFTLFLDQAQMMIDILEKTTGADGYEAWKSAAHRFKGSSGNLGAMKLHHLCKRAETHFTDTEPKKMEMLAAIQAETRRVAAFFSGAMPAITQ